MTMLKPGVNEAKKVAALMIEGEFATALEAAKAVLALAYELYEAKAKFAIAGQIKHGEPWIGEDESRMDKVLFGPYGTRNQAEAAGDQLAFSSATGEEFRWWVLPINTGTPAVWFRERKAAREAGEVNPVPQQTKGVPMHMWKSEMCVCSHPKPEHFLTDRGHPGGVCGWSKASEGNRCVCSAFELDERKEAA